MEEEEGEMEEEEGEMEERVFETIHLGMIHGQSTIYIYREVLQDIPPWRAYSDIEG